MKTKTLGSQLLAACCLASLAGCSPENVESATNAPAEESVSVTQQAEQSYNPGSGWNLVWSDEFNGTSLNTANWTTLNSNWDPVTNNCNFGTGEMEYPRSSNVTVGNGVLTIAAQRTSDNPMDSHCTGYGGRSFYSGRLHTKGKVEKQYGKIVASIKVPSGAGMWPAFWTLGANISQVGWPTCGEMDIQEWNSGSPTWQKSAMHWYSGGQADWGTGTDDGVSLADSFHVYEVEWNANLVTFRVDGKTAQATFTNGKNGFMSPHYIILNLAMGGNWYPGMSAAQVDLPAGQTKTMQVEWIRWYQQGSGGGTTPSGGDVAITNPSFESGMSGWNNWSSNGTTGAGFVETYNGGHTGSYHLSQYSTAPFDTWTYQAVSGLANGNYKARAWIRKAGSFNFSRLQIKSCPTCTPATTDLGTYSGWTQIETPVISVTGGYAEFGVYSNSSATDGSPAMHADDFELVKM